LIVLFQRHIALNDWAAKVGNLSIYLYAIFQQATQFSVGWFKWGPANNLQDIHFNTLLITLHKLITITFHQKKGGVNVYENVVEKVVKIKFRLELF